MVKFLEWLLRSNEAQSNGQSKQREEVLNLAEREHGFLRQELNHLKDCQIKFLTFSVITTGAIFGWIIRGNSPSSPANISPGIAYLIPLVILLPAWWIFFDKATTITRIVGYYRAIEMILLRQCVALEFLGWERSLARFRRIQKCESVISRLQRITGALLRQRNIRRQRLEQLNQLLFFQQHHRYWVMTFYTFFVLSMLSVGASIRGIRTTVDAAFVGCAAVAVAIWTVWNATILWDLTFGSYSYDRTELQWRSILKLKTTDGHSLIDATGTVTTEASGV